MKERFENPPLVELVAEVRWVVDAGLEPGAPFFQGPNSQSSEEFLSRLLAELAQAGYGVSERLIPPGFPLMNQAPVARYKKSGRQASALDETASTLFQAGAGLFTVNAVPPYKSWNQFRPVVALGLEALINSNPPKRGGFNLTLRYIDAFKQDLTQGRSHRDFLQDVMGIRLLIPTALEKLSTDGSVVVPMLQTVVPLAFGSLQIQFAEGNLQGENVFLMENIVTIAGEHGNQLDAILSALDEARSVVHQSFVELTRPIHEQMIISEGE
ncbi:TIGR04255 family protein [Stutzerimonas nitrititolerans]|uniref:TIGR04255 family protein n=1 Tax=Stutzerimonas nitrititolerans TaxID=2482751 RepID=UPI0028AE6628|nr:TIGR04255 family protein [Stutzerimonas nitrititolerans]